MNSFLRVLIGAALAALALTSSATAAETSSKLVVRGVDTVVDGPCPAGVCQLTLKDGAFRGTHSARAPTPARSSSPSPPASRTARAASAPRSRARSSSAPAPRTASTLALSGDSCQDGAGDVTQASFTGAHALRRQARHRDLRQDPRLRHRAPSPRVPTTARA